MDSAILFATVSGTLVVLTVGIVIIKGAWPRTVLAGTVVGLLIYSGIGAASAIVPHYYAGLYSVFLVAFVYAFVVCHFLCVHLRAATTLRLSSVLWSVDERWAWSVVAWAYVLLSLVPLIYPEIKVGLLVAPPPPKAFTITWREAVTSDIISEAVRYFTMLAFPFYLISLFRFRKSPARLFLLLILPTYFSYCAVSYIGRGNALTSVIVLVAVLWAANPKWRLSLAVAVIALMPLAIGILDSYVRIRLGLKADLVGSIWKAFLQLFVSETSFPAMNAMPVIESRKSANLMHFFNWLVSLPIPGSLLKSLPRTYLNAEMSEIILGIPRGSGRFYGVMAGLVGESVYIYGRHFFWVHGFLLGALASFVVSIIGKAPQLLAVRIFAFVLLSYNLNRGGTGAVVPVLVNAFLLYYALVFVAVFWPRTGVRCKRSCVTEPL